MWWSISCMCISQMPAKNWICHKSQIWEIALLSVKQSKSKMEVGIAQHLMQLMLAKHCMLGNSAAWCLVLVLISSFLNRKHACPLQVNNKLSITDNSHLPYTSNSSEWRVALWYIQVCVLPSTDLARAQIQTAWGDPKSDSNTLTISVIITCYINMSKAILGGRFKTCTQKPFVGDGYFLKRWTIPPV